MRIKIITFLIFFLCFSTICQEVDDDIIDITNITIFPQDYNSKIRAGYLAVTYNTQLFYYIFAER